MKIISYPHSYKALDAYIEKHNEQYDSCKDKIRGSVILTMKELIRIYGISLIKANAVCKINLNKLPSLETNNPQLAKMVRLSSRTIQRHIAKLQDVGLITEKIWHGSNANYELFINPEVLCINDRLSVKDSFLRLERERRESSKETENQALEEERTPKCPHTYAGTIRTNRLMNVEKPAGTTQRSEHPFTGAVGPAGTIAGTTGKIGALRAGRGADSEKKEEKEDPARSNILRMYVRLLWNMAQNLLYKGVYLTDEQIEIGKKLIRKWYQGVETEQLSKVHKAYRERISLAARYVSKDPEKRFAQFPFRYFDPENPHGFAGTEKWHKDYKKRQREVYLEYLLQNQIQKYINNQKKKAYRRKPQLKIFRECEKTLRKHSAALADRFYAVILDHEQYRQIQQP